MFTYREHPHPDQAFDPDSVSAEVIQYVSYYKHGVVLICVCKLTQHTKSIKRQSVCLTEMNQTEQKRTELKT